jgi:hypothetical protein
MLACGLQAAPDGMEDTGDTHRPRSLLFETPTNHYLYTDPEPIPDRPPRANDTLELPEKKAQRNGCDSFCREFRKYWAKVEERDGYDRLKKQMESNDIDKTWVPHFYLFDSNVVISPFWIIFRNKNWF